MSKLLSIPFRNNHINYSFDTINFNYGYYPTNNSLVLGNNQSYYRTEKLGKLCYVSFLHKKGVENLLSLNSTLSKDNLSKIKKNDRLLFTKSCNLTKEKINKFISDNNILKANKRSNIDYTVINKEMFKNVTKYEDLSNQNKDLTINKINIAKELKTFLNTKPLIGAPKEQNLIKIDNIVTHLESLMLANKSNSYKYTLTSKDNFIEFIFYATTLSLYMPMYNGTYYYPTSNYSNYKQNWILKKDLILVREALRDINSIEDIYKKVYKFLVIDNKGEIAITCDNDIDRDYLTKTLDRFNITYETSEVVNLYSFHGSTRFYENIDEINQACLNGTIIWEEDLNNNVNENLGFELDMDFYNNIRDYFKSRNVNNIHLAKEMLSNFPLEQSFIYLCFIHNEFGDSFMKSSGLKTFKILLSSYLEYLKNNKVYVGWGYDKLVRIISPLIKLYPDKKELIMNLFINRTNEILGEKIIKDVVLAD